MKGNKGLTTKIYKFTWQEHNLLIEGLQEMKRQHFETKRANRLIKKLSPSRDSGEAPASASTLANKQTEKEETNDRS